MGAECELLSEWLEWVKRRHSRAFGAYPLYPQKADIDRVSALVKRGFLQAESIEVFDVSRGKVAPFIVPAKLG